MKKSLALVSIVVLSAVPVQAEEAGRSGQALSVYCNSVPEMGVQRSDSVDNWVKICSVWLNAKASLAEKPRKAKDKDDDAPPSSPAKEPAKEPAKTTAPAKR
jgi:hypothetical protein